MKFCILIKVWVHVIGSLYFQDHVNSEVGISVQLWAANDKGVCRHPWKGKETQGCSNASFTLKIDGSSRREQRYRPCGNAADRCSRSLMHCGSLYNTSWRTHSSPWYLAVPQHFYHSCPPPPLFTVSLDWRVPTGPVWLIAWSNSLLCLSSGEAGLKRTH